MKSEHLQNLTCSRFIVIQFHLDLHIKKKIKERKTDKSVEAPVSGHEIWYLRTTLRWCQYFKFKWIDGDVSKWASIEERFNTNHCGRPYLIRFRSIIQDNVECRFHRFGTPMHHQNEALQVDWIATHHQLFTVPFGLWLSNFLFAGNQILAIAAVADLRQSGAIDETGESHQKRVQVHQSWDFNINSPITQARKHDAVAFHWLSQNNDIEWAKKIDSHVGKRRQMWRHSTGWKRSHQWQFDIGRLFLAWHTMSDEVARGFSPWYWPVSREEFVQLTNVHIECEPLELPELPADSRLTKWSDVLCLHWVTSVGFVRQPAWRQVRRGKESELSALT